MITSLDNKKIKEVVKLRQKKYRDLVGKFVVETENLVREAYNEGLLESVFLLDRYNLGLDIDFEYVTDKVMKKISTLDNCYVLGICRKKENKSLIGNKFLLLDDIQDPGNLGTIIRTSLGFNIDTIILSNATVDLYNEKVIRATEGAIFKINIIRDDLKEVILKLKDKNIKVYGTDVRKGKDLRKINKSNSYALVMGNEGNGVSPDILDLVDENINILVNSKLESLNVGVATGIILYELDK